MCGRGCPSQPPSTSTQTVSRIIMITEFCSGDVFSESFFVVGYNAAPIVVAWVDTDEQIPARWEPPGSKLAIVPVGGLVIANASVVDNRTRPFLATGSPLFANGNLLCSASSMLP